MKTAIVGFAGSGKTTVFNSLTGLAAATGYGGKDKANLGLIRVPDPRVDFLSEMYSPKKTTFAEIDFVDVAGPPGESPAGGLDKALVEHIQKADALVHVIRGFAALLRQALEHKLAAELKARAPGSQAAPFRTQLLCLHELLGEDGRSLAQEVAYAWAALSAANHHHAYELSPGLDELRSWTQVVRRFVDRPVSNR